MRKERKTTDRTRHNAGLTHMSPHIAIAFWYTTESGVFWISYAGSDTEYIIGKELQIHDQREIDIEIEIDGWLDR
jgi:hypothetical protein